MVQRLSWEDVLLSTLTEPSLMKRSVHQLGFDVSRSQGVEMLNLAKEANDRPCNGSDDNQEDCHGHRAVLILVIERCSDETITSNGFTEAVHFVERRCLSSWYALTLANFATHEPTEGVGGHSPC